MKELRLLDSIPELDVNPRAFFIAKSCCDTTSVSFTSDVQILYQHFQWIQGHNDHGILQPGMTL
jgi:hypothetical protein